MSCSRRYSARDFCCSATLPNTALKKDTKAVEVALGLNNLYPNDPEILYETGKVYGNLAFVTMNDLARVAPRSVWRHLAAAEAHERQGSYTQAIQEYREVLRLEPSRPAIPYRVGRSLMGRFWQQQSQDDLTAHTGRCTPSTRNASRQRVSL